MKEARITTHIDRYLFEPVKREFENRHDVRMTNAAFVKFLLAKEELDDHYDLKLRALIDKYRTKSRR